MIFNDLDETNSCQRLRKKSLDFSIRDVQNFSHSSRVFGASQGQPTSSTIAFGVLSLGPNYGSAGAWAWSSGEISHTFTSSAVTVRQGHHGVDTFAFSKASAYSSSPNTLNHASYYATGHYHSYGGSSTSFTSSVSRHRSRSSWS